jgi:hypothetical protein
MLLYAKRETDHVLVETVAAIRTHADQRDYLSQILAGKTFAQADHWLATPTWKRDVVEKTPVTQAVWDCFQMITMPVDHWWRDLETLGKPLSRDQQGLFYKHLAGQIAHACRQETGTTPEILFRVLHKYGQALHEGSSLGEHVLRAPWTLNGSSPRSNKTVPDRSSQGLHHHA